METVFVNYGRFLLLQGQLAQWEQEKETARREILAAERELSIRRVDWECLKKPGFFQRLAGNVAQKQESAFRAYQDGKMSLEQAKRNAQTAADAYEKCRAELDALANAPEVYRQLKESGEVADFVQKAMEHLTPAALDSLNRCLDALEKAYALTRELVQIQPNDRESKKLEYFAKARVEAKRLLHILEQFSEHENWVCDYLRNPDGFLLAAATNYSRLDRLSTATRQLREIRARLKQGQ